MIYFIYEPEAWGNTPITIFATKAEWQKGVDEFDFMQDYCDDGWSEMVEHVFAGIAPRKWDENNPDELDQCDYYEQFKTHHTVKINERQRPDDVDEEGFDKEGTFWGEWEYICSYAFDEIKKDKAA